MPDTPQKVVIRNSTEHDVPAMLAIYRHHIYQGVGELGAYADEPLRAEDLKIGRASCRERV